MQQFGDLLHRQALVSIRITMQKNLRVANFSSMWIPKAGATALNLLSKLRDKYDQWWYFLDHPEVPPDNNLAERSLRLAVTKRKISGGSRSLSRFGDTASLLTVVQSCRSQLRCVIDFFGEALGAHVGHAIVYPSLIPFSATWILTFLLKSYHRHFTRFLTSHFV